MQELSELLGSQGIPAILKYSHALIALLDAEGRILECNPTCEALKSDSQAGTLQALLTLDSRPFFDRLAGLAIEKRAPAHGALILLPNRGSGETEYDCTLIPTADGRILFFAELVSLDPVLAERYQRVSRRAAQLKLDYEYSKQTLLQKQMEIDLVVTQAREVASTDALTFLPNRRQILGDLQREVMVANRYHTPLSVSMLDVDHFKVINDTYGHAVGDLVLRQVASYLRDNVRNPDLVGRYGGEEFLVLLPGVGRDGGLQLAEALREVTGTTQVTFGGKPVSVAASVGVYGDVPSAADTVDSLIEAADRALYRAKEGGRNRVEVA